MDGGAVVDVGDAGAEVDLVGADPEVLVDRGIDEDLGLGLGFAFVAFSTRSISKKKSMVYRRRGSLRSALMYSCMPNPSEAPMSVALMLLVHACDGTLPEAHR